jgi:hypothetical protein
MDEEKEQEHVGDGEVGSREWRVGIGDASPEINKSDLPTGQAGITTSDIQNMEVHHHPHVEKKSFKEYLLEGLMIFLAVTMGCFAETIRENITEKKIAGELAENLYKEVYSDSIFIQQKIANRLKVEDASYYFIRYVKDSSLINPSEQFYKAFTTVFSSLDANFFEPKDGILNQLKNSGALRYFRSNQLQENLGEFSVAIASVRIRNEEDFGFIQSSNKPFALAHLDFITLIQGRRATQHDSLFFQAHPDSITSFGTPKTQALKNIFAPKILNIDQFNRVDAMNLVSMYIMILQGARKGRYQAYLEKNHALLETLRKEYPVKNE